MLVGHGDDGYKHIRPIKADFSTNVWYGGAPKGLKEYLFERWDKVQRYPEVLAESLREKIAVAYGLSADQILVANGSTESIYMIATAFSGKHTGIVIPAFAEYEDACKMHGHQMSLIPWEELEKADLSTLDLLFICNPNNPTGEIFRKLKSLIADNRQTIFVVDEAFIEFTLSFSSVIPLLQDLGNLVVMRSMTKLYAIPGLRLAYLLASPALIGRIKSFKQPWTVNTMAIDAGHFIFDRLQLLTIPLSEILEERQRLMDSISALGFRVYPSQTHFFIAETPIFNAAKLKEFLLSRYDLLIRDAGNFRGLTEKHFRIACLSAAKNKLLLNALSEWIRTSS